MFSCPYCNREFKNKSAVGNHITKKHIPKQKQFVKMNYKYELDITYEELELYKQEHNTCEICGRTVDEVVKYTGKTASKQLCIDHNHNTNRFRGMLCQACNRQLGWYEKYQSSINSYLNK